MDKKPERARKTYTIGLVQANNLARKALDIGDVIGKTVHRQGVLDTLVDCLDDPVVYKKVIEKLSV